MSMRLHCTPRFLVCLLSSCLAASSLHAGTLVAKEATWKYRKGNSEATPLDQSGWRTNGFNDSGWSSAQAPIGYGNPPETAWINTTLDDMEDGYSSVYLRKTFTVADPSDITALKLIICWDDGFIAWINGDRVADREEPESAAHYALASGHHESWEADDEDPPAVTNALYEDIWLDLEPDEIEQLLVVGDNVLAIQVFNSTLGSSDMCIDAKLRTAVADTKFSHDRGFYDSSFSVTISTKTPGATIRYTTDGTWPTITYGSIGGTNVVVAITKTTALRAAAYHSSEHHATDEDTQTYIFLANTITQPTSPAGFPATWGAGDELCDADYEMDPGVVNDSRYKSSMTNYLKSLPSMSIVTKLSDIFGSHGFYRNGGGDGDMNAQYEKRVSVEMFHPDGRDGFQINCGLRPRSWVTGIGKRSFTLLFKSEHGPSKLRYPVFQDAPVDSESAVSRFDRLILRAGANDSWVTGGGGDPDIVALMTYLNDPFGNESERACTGVSIHNNFVHLYINGLYWGLYHVVERPDAWFTSSYFGGEKDGWYAGNHGANTHGAISGDGSRWWSMLSQADKDMSVQANYTTMKNLLDVTRYIDHCLLRFYTGMGDWAESKDSGWGYVNNYYVGNPNGGAVKYFSWDSESAWRVIDDPDPAGYHSRVNNGAWIKPQFHERYYDNRHYYVARPMRGMANNSDFRTLFSDRLYKHCFNGGALSDDTAKTRWDTLAARIEDAMVTQSARWGDAVRDVSGTQYPVYTRHDHWYPARDRIRGLMTGNAVQLRDAARTTYVNGSRLYPSQDPPGLNQHGGEVVSGFQIKITNPNASGSIYYTTNGVDPRASGGGSYAGATKGLEPLYEIITKTTHLKARVRTGTWSALHEATFHVVFSATDLRLTEIMYKPRDKEPEYVAGSEFEFLEFKNTGGSTVGLSSFTLSGVDYTFPVGTTVGAGDFLLVVRNLTEFQSRYPGVTCETLQWTSGGLNDGGEKIRLKNPEGNTILSCEYDDDPPWPLGPDADGMGRSLANTNPGGDPDNPENWRASSAVDGSPGADDPAPSYGLGVVVNEVMAHTDDTKGDKIELYNSGAGSVNITGWYLSDAYDPGNPGADYKLKKWLIPSVTIPAGDYHVFYETNHTPAFGAAFQLHEWGDQVYLASASAGNLNGYIVGGEFGASENGVALGRYETSEGVEDFFPALVSWTGSNANNDPKVGPVVINEIMYNPPETGSYTNEYIELLNLTGSSTNITDWDLEGAGGYIFPPGTVIEANNYLVLLDTNSSVTPSLFRSQHGIPGSVPILGANFDLGNNGEALRLEMPNSDSDTNATDILVDRVRYNDRAPWPSQAAGGGPSLERLVASDYGNEPLNWRADNDGGTPGAANTFVAGVAIHKNSNWRYHDKGYSLGISWRDPDYSDSSWDDGDGVLGYNEPDVTTVVSYGPDSNDKYRTTYFRKTFTFADAPGTITELKLHTRYDDGFVAYINGQEVLRRSIGSSDPMPYAEYATGPASGTYEENTITSHASKLVQGANVLAVELHQVSSTSSDIAWDCRLTYAVSGMPTVDVDITPHGAAFTDPINVTITANPTDATIYYTTDGSAPDGGDPTIVSGNSIQITGGCTVRARGEKVDYNAGTDSAVFSYVPRTASFGSASSSAVEEAGTVNLAVVLSTTSGSQITVDYSVDAGSSTAAEGSDFSLSAGTLTFAPGVSSRNIALQILEDTREEESETVVVQLDSAVGAGVGSPSSHTHTIQDDDGPDLAWVAYNDMMWAATDPTANITLISGWVTNGWMTNSGELVDYASGTGVGVTLSLSDPGTYYEDYRIDQGGNATSGTDAYTNFNGIVGCFGNMAGANDCTWTFSGLNTDNVYTLVVFGNRNRSDYTDRVTEFVLGPVDSFVNDSTPGAEILTNSVPDDTTKYSTGHNTVFGYVARWTGIRTTGTTMTLTVQGGTHRYVNAMKLECRSSSGASEVIKIAKGSTWKYRKGTAEASVPPTDWRRRVFDDSGWSSGPAPIGYGDKVATSLADMYNGYSCVFYRQSFSIGSPDIVERLKLDIEYDDGFIAWVNGEEVARVNVAGNTGDFMAHTTFAISNQAAMWAKDYLGAEIPQLVPGANVLAAQMFNRTLDSGDADLNIQLSVVEGSFLYVDDDADDDDMDDAWEVANCDGGDGDPNADGDLDGANDLGEYIAGTLPTDGASVFSLVVDSSGDEAVVSFNTIEATGTGYSGMTRRYTLERRLDLFSGGLWVDVPGYANLAGNGTTVSYTNPPGQNIEYYRARVWLE